MKPTANKDNTIFLAELKSVNKVFRPGVGKKTVHALKNISLEVRQGEILGLLGPNGAGKTTTIKLLLGLLFPSSGKVRLFGENPADPASRKKVGFLPENPYFYDYLTAREYMSLAARLCGMEKNETQKAINYLLEVVGLTGAEGKYLRKFSKGMLQRLGLAQALINSPDLLILDEPMSGLDPLGRRQVRELIRNSNVRGRSVLFSSHVLSDVEAICDRVIIINHGQVAAQGLLSDLVSRNETKVEITVERPPQGLKDRLEAKGCVVSEAGGVLSIRLADPKMQDVVIEEIHGAGGNLHSLVPLRPSLEDVFMKEVGEKAEGV
ncbi:MAG: ABC transporter ATP-binding protein [Deltaproteobacteria bacterium]|nr:ABC transporter ATP-binding protein [Deltaproteobacteria bacterium]